MGYERLNESDIGVGQEMPYAVYDVQGKLLLRKGYIIESAYQLRNLMSRGMYRRKAENSRSSGKPLDICDSPFVRLQLISQRLTGLLASLAQGRQGLVAGICRLAKDVQQLCKDEPDAMLAAVHLQHEDLYTTYHALHCGILCEIVGHKLGLEPSRRLSVMAAALTANIAILDLQNELYEQKAALTAEQRFQVQAHPVEGVRMLKEAGVDDALWLDVILQHHERIHGEGYPAGLAAADIIEEAGLLAVADRYAAMVSSRSYRKPMMAFNALREFLIKRGNEFDEKLSLLLIKEMGIYPPGTFVRLANSDTAIIIQRSQKDSMQPMASSFISPRGGLFITPLRRDCSHKEYAIKEVCSLDEGIRLNLHTLWGYK